MSVSGSLQFARQSLARPADALINGMGATAEDLTDLTMGQLLPNCEAEQLLIGGPQPEQRVHDLLFLGTAQDLRLRIRDRVTALAADPQHQATLPLATAVLVGEHAAGDAVEPGELAVLGHVGAARSYGRGVALRGGLDHESRHVDAADTRPTLERRLDTETDADPGRRISLPLKLIVLSPAPAIRDWNVPFTKWALCAIRIIRVLSP